MSYVRWSSPGHPWDYDSDLYIYDVSGGCTCCGCALSENGFTSSDDPDGPHPEMVAHVLEHIEAGHAVPEFVIPRLQAARGFN